jgi:hypothetical protein
MSKAAAEPIMPEPMTRSFKCVPREKRLLPSLGRDVSVVLQLDIIHIKHDLAMA